MPPRELSGTILPLVVAYSQRRQAFPSRASKAPSCRPRVSHLCRGTVSSRLLSGGRTEAKEPSAVNVLQPGSYFDREGKRRDEHLAIHLKLQQKPDAVQSEWQVAAGWKDSKASSVNRTAFLVILHEARDNLHKRIDQFLQPFDGLSEISTPWTLAQYRCPQVETLHELPVVDCLNEVLKGVSIL